MANRIIPLVDGAVEVLDVLKDIAASTFGQASVDKGEALIVSNREGKFIETNKYNKWLKRYCREAGISLHTSH